MARPLIFCKLEGAEVRAQFYELDEASLKSGRELPADDQPAARMASVGENVRAEELYIRSSQLFFISVIL